MKTATLKADRTTLSTSDGPIVVATDGLPQSRGALAMARTIAQQLHQRIRVVAVRTSMALVGADGQMLIDPNVTAELRADLLRRAREQCRGIDADAVKDLEVLDGQPAQIIADLANVRHAPLIVLGLGRHEVVDRMFGDETALKVVRASRVPVLAVPECITTRTHHAVVGVDFSEGSVRAAQVALTLLGENGMLDLVHVVSRERLLADGWVSQEECTRFVRHSLTRFLARLTVPNGVVVKDVTLCGDPARELVAYANDSGADLIAAGSHGHGFITRLLVGSVTTRLLRTSTCAVLVIPADADRRDLDPAGASVTLEVRRSRWGELLDDFTRRNTGRRTRLEVDDPMVGAQPQEDDLVLAGVTFDPIDGHVEIMLGELGAGEPHLTRSVSEVDAVNILTNRQGQDVALRLGHGAGQTILTVLR